MSELEVVEQGTDSEGEEDSENGEQSETDDEDEPTEGGKSVSEEVLVDQVLEQAGAAAQDLDEEDEEEEQRVYAVEPVQVSCDRVSIQTSTTYG